MPLSNGVAGCTNPDPAARQTVADLVQSIETLESRVAFYHEKAEESVNERSDLLNSLAQIIRAQPDRVIAYDQWCYLLIGGLIVKRPLVHSYMVQLPARDSTSATVTEAAAQG